MSSATTVEPLPSSASVGSSSTFGTMVSAGLSPATHPPSRAEEDALELAWVDDAVRLPTLLFFGSAILWLLLGTTLKLLVAVKLNFPGFLADFSWLTYGRVQPAANESLLYGWAVSAGMGAGIWVMARLCQARIRSGGVLIAAWALWNLALSLGVGCVLNGQGTATAGLDFPRFVSPLVFTALLFIAVWPILLFCGRRAGSYVSQWYVLAAFIWLPSIYATANLVLFFLDAQGPVQAVVAAWYNRCLLTGVLIPFALAVAYYIVPKVLGKPVRNYQLAVFGFWGWLILASWTGAYGLIGGPVPAWMISVSIVANALTLLPVAAIVAGLVDRLKEHPRALRHSPSLRFIIVGAYCFLAATIFSLALGFRSVNELSHFSEVTVAFHELLFYAFVSMTFFGAVYYITPRLLGAEWASSGLIRVHFWFSLVGVGLMIVALTLGGFIQGLGLDDPKVPMIAVLSLLKPFLAADLVAVLLLLTAHVALTASTLLIFLRHAGNCWGWLAALLSGRPLTASPASTVSVP
jgi:cytochrome c oxidase cbb3-type subunit 1